MAVPVPRDDDACQLAGSVLRPDDEATQGTERVGGRRTQEMQTRFGRLESDIELRISLASPHGLAQRGSEERVPRDVYAIACTDEEMIDHALAAIAEAEAQLRAGRRRLGEGAAGGHGDRAQARYEPARAGAQHRDPLPSEPAEIGVIERV